MADIRRRLMRMIDPRWLARLAEDLELYLQGVRWEHAVERSGRPLTLAIYRHMRPLTSAVNICLDLAGAFECPDDPTLGREPLVRELERIANNHISWVNDIFSLDRERAHGQTANLVVALASSEGLSLAQALDRAIELCNAEMEAFTRLESQLQQLGIDGAEPYVTAIARWIRGSIDWHVGAARYVQAQPLTIGVDASVREADAA
jgi:5-epi-alpha-selinene synthase